MSLCPHDPVTFHASLLGGILLKTVSVTTLSLSTKETADRVLTVQLTIRPESFGHLQRKHHLKLGSTVPRPQDKGITHAGDHSFGLSPKVEEGSMGPILGLSFLA